jgi:hypothetical protein
MISCSPLSHNSAIFTSRKSDIFPGYLGSHDKSMILNERYEIERKLGEGGLGIVYRARDLTLYSKVVVIKVLKEEIGQSAYWKRKFEKEKEALACCQNPHIVGIHDSGKLPSGDLFLVMEFVEGGPLRSVMKGEMPLVRIAHLVRQIGQALSYAHERVIFHRDLKPENIMLRTAEGEDFVILIDFGIATVKESQPATRGMKTAIVGTPPYMAPEQILGEPSPATDIYALGVIAYEMVTGHKLFNMPQMEPLHKQLAQLYKMQQTGVGAKAKELRPDLPEAAHTAILKALSFDPKDRYPQARDFGEALANALTGKKERSLPEAPTEPMTPVDVLHEPQLAEVVISYCAQDLSRAIQIAERLRAAGVMCWMADHGHEVTLNDRSETIQAVKQCKVVLLLCSDAALCSTLVKQDMQLAWSYERPFLPLLIEPIDFPEQAEYWFEGQQWIEVMNLPPEQWLPMVLRALANTGVHCPGVNPASLARVPVIQPTRLDHSLQSLLSIARFTDQIWPVPAERVQRGVARSAVRGLGAPQEDVQHGYRLGSRVRLAIQLDQSLKSLWSSTVRGLGAPIESEYQGHLLLLDKGPEGIIYCLCPSQFAPDTRLRPSRNDLPQAGSRYDAFVVTGKPGREHLLAIITNEPLGLDWLPTDPRIPARVLRQADIDALLARLRNLEGDRWTALSTYFDVVD